MRPLNAEQFAMYAPRQNEAADGIIAQVRSSGGMCACGRARSRTDTCVRMREHHLAKLAMFGVTA